MRKPNKCGIPDSVTKIGVYAFYNCINLTSVTIPNGLKNIEYCTFINCRSLTSVTIPNSVTTIGSYAFEGCKNLTSVVIPDSVVYIDYGTFYGCTNLKYAKFLGNAPSLGDYVFDSCSSSFRVYYNYGKTGFTNPWNGYTTAPLYSVTYDSNRSNGGKTPTDINTYLESNQVKVLGNTGSLNKTGFTFAGWNTKADGSGTNYQAGTTFAMGTKNAILYAKWTINK